MLYTVCKADRVGWSRWTVKDWRKSEEGFEGGDVVRKWIDIYVIYVHFCARQLRINPCEEVAAAFYQSHEGYVKSM